MGVFRFWSSILLPLQILLSLQCKKQLNLQFVTVNFVSIYKVYFRTNEFLHQDKIKTLLLYDKMFIFLL